MKQILIERIRCPRCKGALVLESSESDDDEIVSGLLRCLSCDAEFPIVHGVPRMLLGVSKGGEQVKKSFELQWKQWGTETRIFGRNERDAMAFLDTNLTHPTMGHEALQGAWVLDAGCGHGMYVRGLAERGANVIGIDIGEIIGATYDRVRQFPNAHCLQADLLRPALKPASFDFVFSNGVIHHTTDTRLAFTRIAALVRPGGYLGVWVYPVRARAWELTQQCIRAITTRLPRRLLYYLCYLPVPLLTVFPAYSGTSLHTSSWRQCAQVVFDFYAPEYQTHHRPDEIRTWFQEEGFEDIIVMPDPLSVTGRRARDRC